MTLRQWLRVDLIAIVGLASLAVHATPVGPVKLSKAEADAVVKDIAKQRAEAEEALKSSPTSYLATVDRKDFDGRPTMTVGRAPGNDVRIDDDAFTPHHLRVTVQGDRFHVEAVDPAAHFIVGADEKRDAVVDPSNIKIDRFLLRLSHQRFPAIIVFDPRSPRFALFKGLKYFPVDLSYRYELPLTRDPKPETIVIMSTRGNRRHAERLGWFEFMVGSVPARLEAVRLLEPGIGENDVSVFFRDATTARESYPLGRYVDAKKLPSGNYLLDFNLAYNPACAFSDHYNCPVPPRANTLVVAIRAGEMDAHYH